MTTRTARFAVPAVLTSALVVAAAIPASALGFMLLPAGVGCPGVNLGLEGTGGNLHTKTFVDEEGNDVRIHTAGKGEVLRSSRS